MFALQTYAPVIRGLARAQGDGALWSGDFGAVDLYETDDTVYLQMALPGSRPEDISVVEQQGILTIRVEQRRERRANQDTFTYMAWSANRLHRSFRLPAEVDAGQAEAALRDGVLTIALPKTHTRRAHKITIQPSGRQLQKSGQADSWLKRLTSWLRWPHARPARATA